MALAIGSHLTSYEITGLLGAGGEVYRARDMKLNRDVAIKLLPDAFARDPDRVARFHREAQTVAALNHPNIAAIHELGDASGSRFLVLELVEGETLAERIGRGPILVEEALNYDITRDGKRFVGIPSVGGQASSGMPAMSQIQIVLNWFEDVRQRAGVR